MKLYFDGAEALANVVREQTRSRHFVVREGWSRVTMPIQAALMCIRTVGCQTIRGTTNILTGVFIWDKERIKSGLKDYLSMLIQAIALPLIGVVATFHPKAGLRLLNKLKNGHVGGRAKWQEESSPLTTRYQKIVGCVFRGIGGIPGMVILGSTSSLSSLLRGKIVGLAEAVVPIVHSVISLAAIFGGVVSERLYVQSYRASNWMDFYPPKDPS
ncbi:MAG: hypothetical protein K1000chlam4_00142 [Chlamydiae bacterium]|nr:hypothetical protein [Chlamydiota bacterium]